MQPIIDLSTIQELYKGFVLIGVESYRTESHNWVEMNKSTDTPEEQIKLAMSQGATQIVLLLHGTDGQQVIPVSFRRFELLTELTH